MGISAIAASAPDDLAERRAAVRIAAAAGVPTGLFVRLLELESGFSTNARSPAGAEGIAQLMPETAAALGVHAAMPFSSMVAAADLLRAAEQRFGSWIAAAAAYNA